MLAMTTGNIEDGEFAINLLPRVIMLTRDFTPSWDAHMMRKGKPLFFLPLKFKAVCYYSVIWPKLTLHMLIWKKKGEPHV